MRNPQTKSKISIGIFLLVCRSSLVWKLHWVYFRVMVTDVVLAFASVGCDYHLTDTRLMDGSVIFLSIPGMACDRDSGMEGIFVVGSVLFFIYWKNGDVTNKSTDSFIDTKHETWVRCLRTMYYDLVLWILNYCESWKMFQVQRRTEQCLLDMKISCDPCGGYWMIDGFSFGMHCRSILGPSTDHIRLFTKFSF